MIVQKEVIPSKECNVGSLPGYRGVHRDGSLSYCSAWPLKRLFPLAIVQETFSSLLVCCYLDNESSLQIDGTRPRLPPMQEGAFKSCSRAALPRRDFHLSSLRITRLVSFASLHRLAQLSAIDGVYRRSKRMRQTRTWHASRVIGALAESSSIHLETRGQKTDRTHYFFLL